MKRESLIILRRTFLILTVLFIYIWAFIGLPNIELKETSIEIVSAIISGLFQPDWGYVYDPAGEDLLRGLLDTVAIALLGTFIAGILCIPFSFMAANNIVKTKAIVGTNKFMLSFIRVFPDIVLALLFIKAVGPGAFAGVLALGIGAVGMLGKLISESIEGIDLSAREALVATGANPIKIFMFAVVPQVLPNFFSFILYRFEVNVRAATVLGVIGAGGIGTPLIFALSVRDWERVGIILLGIIVMVTLIDLISGKIRSRLT
ncbi:phosphonate ABC transporter, permease protein PhnE [Pseudogracilibacillus auburnensis]|uniref:phosphonate ABC transporter, permease protein PhnE n=1 Tax=Pseudogracilibacillus auburnensis TaxID=1494959 RepID=UPI001A96B23F|nr:phosphonate ABC transporter, permease protein PhnE [Pseudogracilibacillus auburnensis]MBO1002617.1 phosphonate ABC transporter, permease protein PhnE [Pseudogracilibacillus auburnensis]